MMNCPLRNTRAYQFAVAIVVAQCAPLVVRAARVEPRVETLPNGLKLMLVERHEQPTVSAGVFYDVGSVNDPAGKSGIAHLFEHMLFKGSYVIGTKDFEAEKPFMEQIDALRVKLNAEMDHMRIMKRRGQIDDVLDPKQWTPEYSELKRQEDELIKAQREYVINNELFNLYTTNGGAGLNAGTSNDITMYFVQLPANKIELFFWLESDRMVNGIMREFYVERDNVREERRLRTESTPTGKLDEAFEALFWQSHPYGIPVLGWASEVESITADDVREFYKVHYAPNNARVVLVGDFDSNRVVELARKYFGRLERGGTLPPPVITEEPKPISVRRLDGEADTNPEVTIRFHGVAIGHKDEPVLEVIASLLSGKTGRLYKRLITKDDLAIGRPRASNDSPKYAGYFEVNATVKEGKQPEEVEQAVLEEIAKLQDGDIPERELQKVKNQVLASSVQRLKSNFGLMLQLGLYDTYLDWHYINEFPDKMLKVTVDDIRRAVRTYFDPATRTVAVYRTKKKPVESSPGGGDEAELQAVLAKLPPDAAPQVKMMLQQVRSSTDAEKLKQRLKTMQDLLAAGQAPPDQTAVMQFMVKAVQSRLAELEGAAKENN